MGEIYDGKIVKVVDFGAFVNFFGAKDGLVHVSELAAKRVNKVSDVVSEGQAVKVKLLGFDNRGKVRLSMKQVDQVTGEDLSKKQAAEDAPAGEPDAPAIRMIEGWILGRSTLRTLGAGRARGSKGWQLHAQLAADTVVVCELDLCQVLLSRDSSFPWLILVPRRMEVRELFELTARDRQRLTDEITQASIAMAAV